jgi:hypothetical protein
MAVLLKNTVNTRPHYHHPQHDDTGAPNQNTWQRYTLAAFHNDIGCSNDVVFAWGLSQWMMMMMMMI